MSLSTNENKFTKEDLNKLGIYELRDLGRDLSVSSPTTLKKEQLIDCILDVLYGSGAKKSSGTLRGRPTRNKQKSTNIFINLIESVERPQISQTFIDKEEKDDYSFDYSSLITTKVASPKAQYINDAAFIETGLKFHKGVVCYDNDKIVVREMRFIPSDKDVLIPQSLIEDYGLRDNDFIEYLLENDKKTIAQLIKINGQFASRYENQIKSNLREQSSQIELSKGIYIKSNASNIVYAPTEADREQLIERAEDIFLKLDYNVVKVCFDRTAPVLKLASTSKKTEFYAQTIGDEYETMAMIETAVEKVQFNNSIGFKSVLLVDNLGWLISVIKTYPEQIYGNFIHKLANLSKGINNNITVVCAASYLPNEMVESLKQSFDVMVNN